MSTAKVKPLGFSIAAIFDEPVAEIRQTQRNPMAITKEMMKNIARMTFYVALPVIDDDGAFRSMIFNVDLNRVEAIAITEHAITFHATTDEGTELQTTYNKRHLLKIEIEGYAPEKVQPPPPAMEQYRKAQRSADQLKAAEQQKAAVKPNE